MKNTCISKLQSKLIGKNLSDIISDIQDIQRNSIFVVKEVGSIVNNVLENDYDVDCFFGSNEKLEDAVVTAVEIDKKGRTFFFQYTM